MESAATVEMAQAVQEQESAALSVAARERREELRAGLEAVPTPDLGGVGIGVLGFLALGAAAALGAGDLGMGGRALPSGALTGMGAVVLTAPALIVVHQFLRLEARPDRLVAALSSSFVDVGRVALGTTPLMLFFSATSGLWAPVFGLLLAALGAFGILTAAQRLYSVERDAFLTTDRPHANGLAEVLIAGWCLLTALSGVRIAVDMARFIAG